MKKTVVVLAALSSSICVAEAITGEAELGYIATSGNSESQNTNARLKLVKETASWVYEGNFTAIGSVSEDSDGNDETTAEKYTAGLKADKKLDERSYLYGLSTWEKDRFNGYDYQATFGVGYGYKLIDDEERTLALEIGPGYRINELESSDSEDETTLRLGETYSWKFSKTGEFNQYLTVETGDESTITKLGASVTSTLTDKLNLKVGIDATNNSDAPDGTEDTDTSTYVTLGYSF